MASGSSSPPLTVNADFGVLAGRASLERAAEALRAVNITTEIVADRATARARILELLPEGGEVHIGLSETMKDLGVTAYVEESGKFNAIRPQLKKLDRTTQRREMAKLATAPDYMLGSVHAVTEDGQLVIGSGTGSQLAPYANGAGRVLLVAGAQKVTATLELGLRRLREYSYPLEDERMKSLGYPGSLLGKILIISQDAPGRTHLILVEEAIGY